MAQRNRVSPWNEIVAIEQTGAYTGNRGCLHVGHDIRRRWAGRRWITCAISYKGWRHEQWAPGTWTALFFADEAVALAAGHRPCALCRRAAYERFRDAWQLAFGRREPADAMDLRLHADRLRDREQRTHHRPWAQVPVNAFVVVDGTAMKVVAHGLRPWTDGREAYGAPVARPRAGIATVLTPACTVEVLRAGYEADLDHA